VTQKPLLVFARNDSERLEDVVNDYFTKNPDHVALYKFGTYSFGVDADADPWYTVTYYHRDFA
jgi:hypothetical protein